MAVETAAQSQSEAGAGLGMGMGVMIPGMLAEAFKGSAAAAEGGATNEETAPFGGGSAAAAAEVGAANERSAPSENGLGEETPCAASSARLAALEAASAEAARRRDAAEERPETEDMWELLRSPPGARLDVRGETGLLTYAGA